MRMHLDAWRMWPLLPALALTLSLPAPSHAIDPKFELDPSALSKKFAAPGAAPAPAKPAQAPAKAAPAAAKPGVVKPEPRTAQVKAAPAKPEAKGAKESAPAKVPGKVAAKRAPAKRERKVAAKAVPQTQPQEAQHPAAGEPQMKLARLGQRGAADSVDAARQLWPRLVTPAGNRGSDRFDFRSTAFSLSLDPERYPTLPASDGGTIVVDGTGSLPPLVRSLIQEKNPQVRIISEDAANRLRFYRSLLSAAQFYSFEEDFAVDFGSDPKITVRADFKIEKQPDSLLKQEVTLLNVSERRRATPEGLVRFLAGNGFKVVDAGDLSYQSPGSGRDLLCQITEKEPRKMLDSLLEALAVPYESGKNIDLYAKENIGVRLDVPVDRYFEDNGERYVAAQFNGDPVTYTLTRLLETKGYRVIMLQEGDDFHAVADKVMARMHIPGRYGEYDLWSERNVGYGVRLSGAMIRDSRNGERNLFVTDRSLDPLVKELADLNGYRMLNGR